MGYNFLVSSNIAFGTGSLDKLSEMLSSRGVKKALLFYGGSAKKSGTADRITSQLDASGIAYAVYDNIIPNPTNEVVHDAYELAKAEAVDGFVALGGGSCIDSGKAIAIVATNHEPSWLYTNREGEYVADVKVTPLPIITVPTTSGTGSEVTPFAVITDERTGSDCDRYSRRYSVYSRR